MVDPYKTRGYRNRNPGNLDRVQGVRWQGELPLAQEKQLDDRFCVFKTHEYGIRAIIRTLVTYATARKARDGSAIDTVREVIERWAPPSENKTNAYVNAVARNIGIDPDQPIDIQDPEVMRTLVQAIIAHECAGLQYDDKVIDAAMMMSGLAGKSILNGDVEVPVVRQVEPTTKQQGSSAAKLTGIAGGIAAVMAALSAAVAELPKIVHSIEEAFPETEELLQPGGLVINVWDWAPVVLSLIMMVIMVMLFFQIRRMAKPEVVNEL